MISLDLYCLSHLSSSYSQVLGRSYFVGVKLWKGVFLKRKWPGQVQWHSTYCFILSIGGAWGPEVWVEPRESVRSRRPRHRRGSPQWLTSLDILDHEIKEFQKPHSLLCPGQSWVSFRHHLWQIFHSGNISALFQESWARLWPLLLVSQTVLLASGHDEKVYELISGQRFYGIETGSTGANMWGKLQGLVS